MLRKNRQPRDKQTRYRPLLIGAKLTICTDSEKLLLLEGVRKGDEVAIEKMILSHIRLAISIVNRYIGMDYYVNDLDSAAMEGVIVAVNNVANGKMTNHNNVTGYIVNYIRRYITDSINHSSIIYTPKTKKKIPIEISPELKEVSPQSSQKLEIWDFVESLIDNDLEKKILELRRDGYTDAEIGELTQLTRMQVYRIRCDLFNRYQRKVKRCGL